MSGRIAKRRARVVRFGRGAILRAALSRGLASVLGHPRRAIFFLLASGVFFTVGPLLRYCKEHRYFAVRAIEISGVRRLDTVRVRVWLGMVEGSSIWAASPSELEARLEAQPSIARAAVRRILPDRLQVTIREREPRALVRHGADAFLVDRAGMVIGPASLQAGDLPIVTIGSSAPARDSVPVAPPPPIEARPKGRGSAPAASSARPAVAPTAAAAPVAPVAKPAAAAPDWMPQRRQLRQAVTVARLLEQGAAGVVVSEVGLSPGASPTASPELVAYSSDGRLTLRLGWGDWTPKLAAVRRVIAHVTGRPELAPRSSTDPEGAPALEPVPPHAVEHLAGTLDVHDPSSVVARWANAGAI